MNGPGAGAASPALFLPCAAGVEALLADEVVRILGPAAANRVQRGGVAVPGAGLADAMALNLGSRMAQRVLWPLAHGVYADARRADEHALYALARGVPWADWITPAQTLRVDVTARRSPLRSLNFAALRVKDAVCDVLRERSGARPSVDTRAPDLALVLHLDATHATLYADTSGEGLFKRGWREAKGEAPLKETLAAAMLAAAGWQGRAEDGPLLDPCCGAGTIAIEAAQLACNVAPGLLRPFAFERLLPWRDQLGAWRRLRAAAQAAVHAPAVAVHAGDVAFRMTDFAAANARRAGVAHAIAFKTADATQRPAPFTPAAGARATLMLNPPYGERIEAKGVAMGGHAAREAVQDEAFFRALGAHWKAHYAGWTAWVLSPDARLPGALRLAESRRVPMWNGPIECRLMRFEIGAARPAAPRDGAVSP